MGIDASGFHTLASSLAGVSAKGRTLAGAAVRKSAADLEAQAKTLAPVDTGNLRASIGTTMHGPLDAEVGPTADYGLYLEYGTSKMGPRPYMNPATDRVEPGFVAAMGRIAEL